MSQNKDYYTLKGYERQTENPLTYSMEDYLEMICRISKNQSIVRIHEIAEKLHVKPSSASKMVNNLKDTGYLEFQKYGYIVITKKGWKTGDYLLHRHQVLENFLCTLNHSQTELEQVEKIEHFINETTIKNLEKLTKKMECEL